MRTVWKYTLDTVDSQTVVASRLFHPLHVAEQSAGHITLWAEVDPQAEQINHTIVVIGTGHEHENHVFDSLVFIGTVLTKYGLVWHVYLKP